MIWSLSKKAVQLLSASYATSASADETYSVAPSAMFLNASVSSNVAGVGLDAYTVLKEEQ